jgi:hypothetical protein
MFKTTLTGPAPTYMQSYNNWISETINSDQSMVGWFFIITVCSFGNSVVSLIIGTTATIPSTSVSLKKEVQQLRNSVVKASVFLFLAIFFLVLAMDIGSNLAYNQLVPLGQGSIGVRLVIYIFVAAFLLPFVLRYILVPKRRYKLKKWMLALSL